MWRSVAHPAQFPIRQFFNRKTHLLAIDVFPSGEQSDLVEGDFGIATRLDSLISHDGGSDYKTAHFKDAKSDINVGRINTDYDTKISLLINSMMESMVEMVTGANTSGATPLCGTAGRMGGSLNRMKCVGDYLTLVYGGIWAADIALKTAVTLLRETTGMVSSFSILGTRLDLDKITNPLWDWVIEVPGKCELTIYFSENGVLPKGRVGIGPGAVDGDAMREMGG